MKNFRLNHNELLQSLGLPTSSNEDLFENIHENPIIRKEPNRELILCMTIDLGEGKKDILNIYTNEDPKDLARQFCVKNHLNLEAVEILANSIIDNLNSNDGKEDNNIEDFGNNNNENLNENYNFLNKLKRNEAKLNYSQEKTRKEVKFDYKETEKNEKAHQIEYERLHKNVKKF